MVVERTKTDSVLCPLSFVAVERGTPARTMWRVGGFWDSSPQASLLVPPSHSCGYRKFWKSADNTSESPGTATGWQRSSGRGSAESTSSIEAWS